MHRGLALATLCSLALACARGAGAERAEPRPAWSAADSAALERRIEELEERLLAHQGRVAFWQELRTRHGNVTAVACENLAEHAAAIRASESRHAVQFVEQRRRRVASAEVVQ